MEFTKNEVEIVQLAEKDVAERAMLELLHLQLAAVGGGAGDVHWG